MLNVEIFAGRTPVGQFCPKKYEKDLRNISPSDSMAECCSNCSLTWVTAKGCGGENGWWHDAGCQLCAPVPLWLSI